MNDEREQSAGTWDYEHATPPTLRDPSLSSSGGQRGTGDTSRKIPPSRRPRPRGVPGSADYYEEIEEDDRPARPRPTRQSREEVEARLRRRTRRPIYTREQDEIRPESPRPASQASRPASYSAAQFRSAPAPRPDERATRPPRDFAPTQSPGEKASRAARDFASEPASARSNRRVPRSDEEYDEYDEYEIIDERRRQPPQRRERGRRRRVLSTMLIGCLGGLLTLIVVAAILVFLLLHNTPLGQNLGVGQTAFTQTTQQPLTLGSATQLIVKNQGGNITINVDQNASAGSLSSVKHVQAGSQGDADALFKKITLSVTPITQGNEPACLVSNCLVVNALVPPNSSDGGLLGSSKSNSVDLTITLPDSFNTPDINAPTIITASAGAGDINVSHFNGVLNLNGNAGNISVTHALIFAGTCMQTLHGNITVGQKSIFDLVTPSKLVPCRNTPSNDPHRPWFSIQSGVGNLDLTLSTNLSNLLLDANTNNGTITDDFNLNITKNSGAETYHGPLVPDTSPTAALYISTSTGNIVLRKQ